MKKLLLFVILLFAAITIRAQSTLTVTNLLTYSAYNGTNNSSAYRPYNYLTISPITFLVQNGGLPSTNALSGNLQVSFDNTNFVTIAVYRPTSTNATVASFTPNISTNRLYFRMQIVTTNSLNAGVLAASE